MKSPLAIQLDSRCEKFVSLDLFLRRQLHCLLVVFDLCVQGAKGNLVLAFVAARHKTQTAESPDNNFAATCFSHRRIDQTLDSTAGTRGLATTVIGHFRVPEAG